MCARFRLVPAFLLLSIVLLMALVATPGGVHGFQQTPAPDVFAEAIQQANVRSGPGVEYPVVGEIAAGTRYRVLARHTLVPWLRLEIPQLAGAAWVYSDLVTVTGSIGLVPVTDQFPPLYTATPTGAGVVSVTPGQPVITLTASPSPQATATPAGPLVITKGEANIRYGPGVDYPSIVEVGPGSSFRLLEFHALYPWLHIALPDSPHGSGWIYEDLVDITGDTSQVPISTATRFEIPLLTPTPQTVIVGSAPFNLGAAPSGALASTLGAQMFEYLLEHRFVPYTDRLASVFVLDLQTGDTFTLYDKVAFSGMSLTKIPILVAYFQQHDGPLSEQEAFLVADTMMCSENITTNQLLSLIGSGDTQQGARRVTALMQSLNLGGTFIMREYLTDPNNPPAATGTIQTSADQQSAQPDAYNQIVPSELGWLLGAIYQCALDGSGMLTERYPNDFDTQECRRMLHVMDANVINVFLEAGVAPGASVIHKHGWIEDTHGDAGIVIGPHGAYVMVVVLYEEGHLLFQEDSSPIIAELSRLAWNTFNPDQPVSAATIGTVPGTCDPRAPAVMDALMTTAPLPMPGPSASIPASPVTPTADAGS